MNETRQSIAQAISVIMSQLVHLRHDMTNNRDQLIELVNVVNALLIPRGWIGIDDDGMMHVTRLAHEDDVSHRADHEPLVLAYHADFIWEYSALNHNVKCVQCRDGSVMTGETLSCGGPV